MPCGRVIEGCEGCENASCTVLPTDTGEMEGGRVGGGYKVHGEAELKIAHYLPWQAIICRLCSLTQAHIMRFGFARSVQYSGSKDYKTNTRKRDVLMS